MGGRRDIYGKKGVKIISGTISTFLTKYEYGNSVNNRIDAKKSKDRMKCVEIYQR
jgi:hypothetical protein